MTISSSQHLLIRHFLSKSLSGVWERLERGRMAHNVSNVLLIFIMSCIHTPTVFLFSHKLTYAQSNQFLSIFFLSCLLSLRNFISMKGHVNFQKLAVLEAERDDLNSSLQLARSQLDETRCLDDKVDALQLIIEQRDQILKEKDSEIKIKSAELESFTERQKKMKHTIQSLESDVKAKTKECEQLQTELEVA